MRSLRKEFSSGTETLAVLDGVDLSVPASEMLAVVGASGVGKSTLLHILGGLEHPTSGRVQYGDTDLFALKDDQRAHFRNRNIGFVFQFHHLLPEFTALENVMMPLLVRGIPRSDASTRSASLLSEVGLSARGHHRPGELSGGEQQRVAVARALVTAPGVVLADEPTGNLDAHTGESVHDLLKQVNQEKKITFIIVTHNDKLTLRADSVYRLTEGRMTRER